MVKVIDHTCTCSYIEPKIQNNTHRQEIIHSWLLSNNIHEIHTAITQTINPFCSHLGMKGVEVDSECKRLIATNDKHSWHHKSPGHWYRSRCDEISLYSGFSPKAWCSRAKLNLLVGSRNQHVSMRFKASPVHSSDSQSYPAPAKRCNTPQVRGECVHANLFMQINNLNLLARRSFVSAK